MADRLGIPFYALNLQEEFGQIIDYFVDEYNNRVRKVDTDGIITTVAGNGNQVPRGFAIAW